ncbi:MAG: DNA primase [Candidatus Riflebacteria bacterium]|nr:DNA primase [Candidatus Riflebacteria bacterium]
MKKIIPQSQNIHQSPKKGFIPDDLIEDIRRRVDIVQFISEYLKLNKSGKTYKALCPFHQEKTPSFYIVPEKQIYHCFGCGKGGNAFTFLMEMERYSYPEAIRFLARKTGVSIPEERDPVSEHKNKLYKTLDEAASFFSSLLYDNTIGKKGREYLSKRGLSPEISREFRFGYSLDRWDALLQKFGKNSERISLLEKTGLIKPGNSKAGFYDTFRNRLMIPITDMQGRTVGFGGRTISAEEPKYLNSPETEIFNKRNILFNFGNALKEIRKTNSVIIVEGYLDAISLVQAGIKNVVATLGTAINAEQIALLARNCDEVFLCYDADEAGQRATLRAISLKRDIPINARVVAFEDPKDDPDSFVRREGREEFIKRLNLAKDIYTFVFERHTKNQPKPLNVNAKEKLIAEFKPIYASIDSEVARDEMIKKLSNLLDLDSSTLNNVFRGKISRNEISSSPKPATKAKPNVRKDQEYVIRNMIEKPELLVQIQEQIKSDDFSDPQLKSLFEFISIKYKENHSSFHPSMLFSSLLDEGLVSRLSEMMVAIEENPLPPLEECVQNVVKDRLNREMNDLPKKIQLAEQKGDMKEVNRLLALSSNLGSKKFSKPKINSPSRT